MFYLAFHSTDDKANETKIENDSGSEMIEHFESWINDEKRIISISALKCARRFIQAELDTQTPGNRGIGRLTDNFPRFGARYRKLFLTMDSTVLSEMELLFTRLILCGYLFAEYIFKLKSDIELTRNPSMRNSDLLFTQWVPLIYSEEGIPAFDNKMKDKLYVALKGSWKSASSIIVVEFMKKLFEKDEYIFLALDSYFNAGILLRIVEFSPPNSINITQQDYKKEIPSTNIIQTKEKEFNLFKIGLFFFIPFSLILLGTYEKAGANAISNSLFGGIFWCLILSLIFGFKKK